MKISLRNARRLEQSITNTPIPFVPAVYALKGHKKMDVVSDLELLIKNGNQKTSDALSNQLDLIEFRYWLRQQIQDNNKSSGVDAFINERKKLEDIQHQLHVYIYDLKGNFYGNDALGGNDMSPRDIIDHLADLKDKPPALVRSYGDGTSSGDFTIPLISRDDYNKIALQISEIDHKISKLNDQILELNISTKFTLSDGFSELLTYNKISV